MLATCRNHSALSGTPGWFGYLVVAILEVAFTAILMIVEPHFPLAKYPVVQLLFVLGSAYWLGLGPTALAFAIGLFSFAYLVDPRYIFWPLAHTPLEWAGVATYLLAGVIGGAAMAIVRNSQRRIRQLAAEVDFRRAIMEAFMQNVPVGLALHDRETRHLLANRNLAEINRLPLEDLVGATVWQVLPPDLAADVATWIGHVFASGEPSIWHDVSLPWQQADRYFAVRHYPVRTSGDEVVGVGAVVFDTTEQVKSHRELERDYEREHRIAETLQTSLMRPVPRQIGGFTFEKLYRAASEEARVGGDFYDVFELGADKVGIVIGDVSGKGLSAAVQVAAAKYSLRGRAYESYSPGTVIGQVNRTLVQEPDMEGFASVFFGILDCSDKCLLYSNAGHAPVMRWDCSESSAVLFEPTGPVLGVYPDAGFEERQVALEPGDELILSTDGIYEVRCGDSFLEIDRLLEIYSEMKSQGIDSATELVERVVHFCDGDLRDDIAILRVTVSSVG